LQLLLGSADGFNREDKLIYKLKNQLKKTLYSRMQVHKFQHSLNIVIKT